MKRLHPHPIDLRPGQRNRYYVEVAYVVRHSTAVNTILSFALDHRVEVRLVGEDIARYRT